MDSYIDTFLETHNNHIFNESDESYNWLYDTIPKDIDTFLETHNNHIFNPYESDESNNWLYDTIPKYTNKEKSWIINLDTKEKKLIIDDIDNDIDNVIPAILADYDWLEELEIDSQYISKINNIPKNIKKLSLFNNMIESIEMGDLPISLEELNISRNYISILRNIPKNVKILDASNNKIKECQLFFNDKLEELSIEVNQLKQIPQFTNNLKTLDISQNKLLNIDNISEYIEELDISMNKIENLRLPNNIKKLYASNNLIKTITKFPENIEYIDLSHNNLYFLCKLPPKLRKGDFSNNMIALITTHTDNMIDHVNGKLSEGDYIINIMNNPLTNVGDNIMQDKRIIHNKVSKVIETNKYVQIKLLKSVTV
jgi:Leucine-rich repeat (LRR) protein